MFKKINYLKHNKKLKLQENDILFDIENIISNEETVIYTFSRPTSLLDIDVEVIEIDGTTRFIDKSNTDIAIINAQSLSPFYANIIWDLVHQLDIGKKVHIYESSDINFILESEYYKKSFDLIEENNNFKTYKKNNELLIEKNRGISSWTFGIPVGPEDPTVLNCCVKRILELNIEDFEIILCGIPHKDFRYFDKVKIVGTDIAAPPVHITRKKNEIAKASSKDNLCIMHDRVLLPSNFEVAIEKFGDMFPFVGFQSIYFADKANLIPRRYSDFGVLNRHLNYINDGSHIDKNSLPYQMMDVGCSYQHCQLSNHGLQYLTGSLYICKRELWVNYPQNEDYYWEEYEDIEFALRTSSKGIPSIINPYSFTQSINSRSIIHHYGYTTVRTVNGKIKLARSLSEVMPFLARKPLFRITEDLARKRMVKFAMKYHSNSSIIPKINTISLTGENRFRLIFELVMGATIVDWEIEQFIKDYCSMLLNENMHFLLKERLVNLYNNESNEYNKKMVFLNNSFLLNQLSNSFLQPVFLRENNDIFLRRHKIHKLNSLIVAFFLKFFSTAFYFKLSVVELAEIINDTTPFRVK